MIDGHDHAGGQSRAPGDDAEDAGRSAATALLTIALHVT
jgi:hypothetical protein